MSEDDVPLFPLEFVLCPGGPLQLRIFEPRYVDMVGRCMKSNQVFGVVAIRSGSEVGVAEMFTVGTKAEIVNWYRDESGLLGIAALGRERFRIEASRRQDDGLYVGRLQPVPAEPRAPVPAQQRDSADFLRRVMKRIGSRYRDIDTDFDDASWVGYRLTEILPLELPIKQSLLEMNDPIARLAKLAPLIRQVRSDSDG